MLIITSSTDAPEAIEAASRPDSDVVETPKSSADSEAPEASQDADPSEDESTTDSDSETPEEDQEQGKQRKGGFQKRIDKLTREKTELQRQLADRTAAKPAAEAPKPVEAAKPVAIDASKPVAANFDTYEEYIEHLTDWKADQRDARKAEAEAKTKADAAQKEVQTAWAERLTAAKARLEDFEEVLSTATDVPISAAMNELILTSEIGPELAYHLAQNPEEATRIAKLAPLATARELGKIEALLAKDRDPETDPKPKTSAAPLPIKPLGSKSVKSTKSPGEMSMKEFNAWRDNGGGR